MNLEELQKLRQDKQARLLALRAKGNAVSMAEITEAEALVGEVEDLQRSIDAFKTQRDQLFGRIDGTNAWGQQPQQPMVFTNPAPSSGNYAPPTPGYHPGYGAAPNVPGTADYVPAGYEIDTPYQAPAATAYTYGVTPAGHPSMQAPGLSNASVPGNTPQQQRLPSIPAHLARRRTSNIRTGLGAEADAFAAYRFGMWIASMCDERKRPFARKAQLYCEQQGLTAVPYNDNAIMAGAMGSNGRQFANIESTASAGGVLVPIELSNIIIRLVEEYGVFRRYAEKKIMTSDTLGTPRRDAGLTVYFEAEATAATESDMVWDLVSLVAKKVLGLTYWSTELGEDAVIDMADILAKEFAWSFAKLEDQCGFIGDGTSTYGGIIGATNALLNLSGTIANIAGLQVASGSGYATSYGSVALSDFNGVAGRLPEYTRVRSRPTWFCSEYVWESVMRRLALAAGGVTAAEVMDNDHDHKRFLGYPVQVTQVMPSVSATSQIFALFGALDLAAQFGDRRTLTMAISEHYQFAQDALTMRASERFDINVHDVGNASATASAQTAGPLVGIITAAS